MSTSTLADLARERINLLRLELVPGTQNMFASIEYQYQPKDGTPRTWHKVVIPVMEGENTLETILQTVREIKDELES